MTYIGTDNSDTKATSPPSRTRMFTLGGNDQIYASGYYPDNDGGLIGYGDLFIDGGDGDDRLSFSNTSVANEEIVFTVGSYIDDPNKDGFIQINSARFNNNVDFNSIENLAFETPGGNDRVILENYKYANYFARTHDGNDLVSLSFFGNDFVDGGDGISAETKFKPKCKWCYF